jgi:hypothetical protein
MWVLSYTSVLMDMIVVMLQSYRHCWLPAVTGISKGIWSFFKGEGISGCLGHRFSYNIYCK